MYRRDYDVAIKRALFHAERSVALDDNDEHAHWCLGGVYWAMDRLEAAIAEYERALEINPNWSIGLSDLGEALCYAGRPEEGLPNIESAMRLNPRDASMFFRYGGMAIGHYLLGNFETAEQWARRAVQRRRQYFYGHVMLTASLVRLGRVQDSQSAASDLLQIFPGFSIAELKKAGFAAAAFQRLRTDLRMAGIPEGPGALAEPDHKN
jgi:adenylate cyclase